MDSEVEEGLPDESPVECCVACLTEDKEKLSNDKVTALMEDFLNREVTFLGGVHFCFGEIIFCF